MLVLKFLKTLSGSHAKRPNMKMLTTAISYGVAAVLCSSCLPHEKQLMRYAQCKAIKDQFNDFQAKAAKGEVMFGVKVYNTEGEINEALKSNLEHYSGVWKDFNCSGSLTDQK